MLKFSELDALFREAEECDKEIFREMRSNTLLVSGDHYERRRMGNFLPNLRFADSVPSDVRIRITQNHLGRIMERLSNSIESYTPDVAVSPHNRREISDQKKADLYNSVKEDAVHRYELEQWFSERCDNFCTLGEVHAYIHFDETLGRRVGSEPLLDEMGREILDPATGQPVPDPSRPVFEGDFVWEKIFGYNLLRDRQAETFAQSPYLIMRKMGFKKDLQNRYRGDPQKLAYIQSGCERTFKIFEVTTGNYRDSTEDEVLLRYHFYRPCFEYPDGYYYITTTMGTLEEGPLPLGLFPIVSGVFDQIDTTPRGRSRIKRLRPYQSEINRCGSKMAEHQITLGDDKMVIVGNSKVSTGTVIPGIRTVSVFGQVPQIIPGRTGAQYLEYYTAKIDEMYQVADQEGEDLPEGQFDPYTLLFMSAKQRKKYGRHVGKFTAFKKGCWDLYFRLAREYMPESRKIKVVGTNEIMNVEEFKSSTDLSYEITLEPSNEDLETKFGRQLILSQTLQYTGSQMSPEQIGQLIRAMPYANVDEAVSDLTRKPDKVKNIMLMLERGRFVPPNRYDDHPYIIEKLSLRTTELDFLYLPQEVQDLYQQCIDAHETMEAEKLREIQIQNAQMIPMSGPRVKVDLYINPDPADPNKVTRASIPQDSVEWLLDRLDLQGVATIPLEELPTGAQSEILKKGLGGGGPQGDVRRAS